MNRARKCDETGDCGSRSARQQPAGGTVRLAQCDGKCCRLEVLHNEQVCSPSP